MISPSYEAGYRVSVPGRICLFGEHQDYLGLPVIAMAIDLRLVMEGMLNGTDQMNFDMLDLNQAVTLPIRDGRLKYESRVDLLKGVINTLLDKKYELPGLDIRVQSTIPINSGTSSSTALVSAFLLLLLELLEEDISTKDLAILAHQAEVAEFNAPGGMMDHLSLAFGGVQMIHFQPEPRTEEIDVDFGTFVLGDSLEPKDTFGVLARCQYPLLDLAKELIREGITYQSITRDEADRFTRHDPKLHDLLMAQLDNRELTHEAKKVMSGPEFDPEELGRLFDIHQEILAKRLDVSTPKIDAMLAAAKAGGALGGKINGSGGGGAVFAYAPDDPQRVARGFEAAGGRARIIRVDRGVESRMMNEFSILSS